MGRVPQQYIRVSEKTSALSAVAKALVLFMSALALIWAMAATSLLQQTILKVKEFVVVIPTPGFIDLQELIDVEFTPSLPQISQRERIENLSATEALSDPLGRIAPEFHVSKRLKKRTKFWFNIYTKYGQYEHVIHHVRYPWIVYKVVDGRELIQNSKGPLWKRRQKLENLVRSERRKVRNALRRLSKRKSFRRLKGYDRLVYNKLKYVSGKRKRVFSFAKYNVRSQLGQKDFFQQGLQRSSKYLPYMEAEFASRGLPTELTRLPFVESSFNEKAESKVGASGVWQIMPAVGRHYLRVGKVIDERNSPLKSTRVAAKLLKQNYRAMKNWPLAVTAYNNGLGNIRKAVRKTKSKDLETIITRYHRGAFKFASSNFYASFLAALHAEKYQESYFEPYQKEKSFEMDELRLASRIRAKSLLKKSGLSKEDFLAWNLDLKAAIKKNILLPKGLKIILPTDHAETLRKRVSAVKKVKSKKKA